MPPDPAAVAKATSLFEEQPSVPTLLSATARILVEFLSAAACTISRVIGDLLVDLVQHQHEGEPARLGHGYLISDYPVTQDVLERNVPQTIFVGDADADPAEVRLLQEMKFDALLMTSIAVAGKAWGLVEVYGEGGRRFDEQDVALAVNLVRVAAARLERLEAAERGQV